MTEAAYAHNHTTDPETGFLESSAYASAFDANRKTVFLEVFKKNGLGLYRTCATLGLKVETVNKHLHADPVFKEAYKDAMTEYADELEAVSRENALNPRSVIERIFQLKSLLPGKYGDNRSPSQTTINIAIDGKVVEAFAKRAEVVDVVCIDTDDALLSGYAQPTLPDSPTETAE